MGDIADLSQIELEIVKECREQTQVRKTNIAEKAFWMIDQPQCGGVTCFEYISSAKQCQDPHPLFWRQWKSLKLYRSFLNFDTTKRSRHLILFINSKTVFVSSGWNIGSSTDALTCGDTAYSVHTPSTCYESVKSYYTPLTAHSQHACPKTNELQCCVEKSSPPGHTGENKTAQCGR